MSGYSVDGFPALGGGIVLLRCHCLVLAFVCQTFTEGEVMGPGHPMLTVWRTSSQEGRMCWACKLHLTLKKRAYFLVYKLLAEFKLEVG